VDSRLESDQLGAPLQDEPLSEPVAAIHLEREAAEVSQPFFPEPQQGPPLTPELARGWSRPAAAARRCRGGGRRRVGLLPQQAWEQR
jgi:hypothetical protein